MENLRYYLPGSILILIAIMIVAVPQILVALVAALIIMAGIGALYVGHMIRKSDKKSRNTDQRFVRAPVFGRWLRGF